MRTERTRHAAANNALDDLVMPERHHLDKAEVQVTGRLNSLLQQRERRDSWFARHPGAARRIDTIKRDVEALDVVDDRPALGANVGEARRVTSLGCGTRRSATVASTWASGADQSNRMSPRVRA